MVKIFRATGIATQQHCQRLTLYTKKVKTTITSSTLNEECKYTDTES